MPYSSIDKLPPGTKSLPKHAKEIYLAAFNSAFEQYKGDEGKSHGTAWAAVKKAYKQDDEGKWAVKEAVHPHGEHVCICSKCGTEKTVGADVKCNTQTCPDCGGPMVAAAAGTRREEAIMKTGIKEVMSANDKRELLQAAVTDSLAVGGMNGPWVRDVYDDELVYEVGGKTYRMSYVIDRKGKAVFGEAERVVPQTVYTPVQEAVEVKINELTEAASRREEKYNADAVADKLLDLLGVEGLTEEAAAPVIKEADAVIGRLSEAAPAKTEDGVSFPKAAYAYTPDPESPSAWKLRLWEDPDKKVTRAQLGRAAAALSPGGFRGQKVSIPSEDLPAVKRKIRAEYRKLDVEDEEIPRWVKEAETRELLADYTPLTEAKIEKGEANIIVIKPGFNIGKTRYYPESTLKRDYGIFEGAKMYADHPSAAEEKNRPERSIRDWVGTLTNVSAQEDGTVVGKAAIVEPWMQEKLAVLRDKSMLDQIGVSINAVGSASTATIEGSKTKVVERFIRARSVDFVTEAGAGGGVALYEAVSDIDIDLVDVDGFKSRRPDIVTLIETEARAQIQAEVKAKMEAEERIKELESQVETEKTRADTAEQKLTEAEKAQAKAAAQSAIKEAVGKAELPEAAKNRILDDHKDDESAEGIEEVVKAEIAYVATLTEAGKIKHLGPAGDPDPKVKEKLEEAFKELTGDEEAGKLAAKGR